MSLEWLLNGDRYSDLALEDDTKSIAIENANGTL